MNEEEIWTTIADCTIRQDWVGILAMADALDDLNQSETAEGLRWITKHLIVKEDDSIAKANWYGMVKMPKKEGYWWVIRAGDCKSFYDQILDRRKSMLEHLQ